MKSDIKNNLLYFSVSFFCSLVLFCSSIAVCLFAQAKNITAADQSIKESYYTAKPINFSAQYLIEITDLPFYFYISLNSSASECSVFGFSKHCIKNSRISFNGHNPLESCKDFFNLYANKLVNIDRSVLERFVNLAGGVAISLPYGITSPSMPEKFISYDSNARLFGFSLVAIMNEETFPDQKRISYYSQIICEVLKSVLFDFTQKDLDFLNDNFNLNISYVDYYNNRKAIEGCFEKLNYNAPEGVWINSNYFLQ